MASELTKPGIEAALRLLVAGTVCADVVESRKLIHIPDRLIELFPRDDDLVPLSAVSYLGAPLLDTDGPSS